MCRARSTRAAAAAVLALWLSGAAPAGQQAPPATPPQPQDVFRSGTQVVEVDVRVFDRDGRFVTSLTRDDFEIIEDGVPQEITAMALVGAAAAAEGPAAPPAAAPPGHEPSATGNQIWVFVFDLNHMTPGDGFARAKRGALEFARERFREGDVAGVVAGNRMVNNRLSSVREELIAAIESVEPNGETLQRNLEITRQWPRFLNVDEVLDVARNMREALNRVITRNCTATDAPPECLQTAEMDARQKAFRLAPEIERSTLETFKAINVLANGLARMPGPKTIVLLSDGFVTGGNEATVRTLVGQVARAGARVYAVDTRGLNRGRGAGIIDQAGATDEAGGFGQFDALENGPNSLAVDTGGLMIRNENNVGRALDRIAADTNQYYVLGYQPANAEFDGTYRSIEVRVKQPGVRVRARRGYLALPPAQMLMPRPMARDEAPAPSTPSVPDRSAIAPDEAPAPAAVVAGRETAATAPVEGAIRLRPDAAERVRALSSADPAAEAAAGREAADGWSAYQRGDLEGALPLFEAAAARPGVPSWVLYALGLTYTGLEKPQAAIEAWERARAAAPGHEPVYMDLAATYASLGDLSSALAILREAEQRWPENADVHNGIGVILVRRGALDQAVEAFTRATEAAPDEAVTHLNLGRTYELRYQRDLRYVSSQRRWVSRESDRRRAAEAYERCVALGGPYAQQAAAALGRLEWSK